jgi:hypothetical protein
MTNDLQAILESHQSAVEAFKRGEALSADLEEALWDYHFTRGDIRNYNCDASEYIAADLAGELAI